MKLYVLDENGEAREEPDAVRWGAWFEDAGGQRILASTYVPEADARVSSVFLGIDHNFHGLGPPLLWETMIFGGKHHGFQMRHATRAWGMRCHDLIVEGLRHDTFDPEAPFERAQAVIDEARRIARDAWR